MPTQIQLTSCKILHVKVCPKVSQQPCLAIECKNILAYISCHLLYTWAYIYTWCLQPGGVRQDQVQQLLLTLHSFHYGIEKRNTWLQRLCISNSLSCLQSTSYILVELHCAQLRPGVIMATETGARKRLRGSTTHP